MPQLPGYEPFTYYYFLEYSWTSALYSVQGFQFGHARYGRSYLFLDYETALDAQKNMKAGDTTLNISYDATDITSNLKVIQWYNSRRFIKPFVNGIAKKPQLLQTLS